MNHHNTFSIDEAKFLKTSKKLYQHLNTHLNVDLKLSQTQEILAQSLGFRNLHELKKVFSSEEKNISLSHVSDIPRNEKSSIFDTIELEQAIQIISNLMPSSGAGDMWRNRALTLLSSVLQALMYMREQKEIVLDIEALRDYLVLDNIIKLFKTRRDFPGHIRSDLKAYLVSLPGFQESAPKQSVTVMEQHGYLQMQFFSALNRLKNIEKDNFIIVDKNWFINQPEERTISAIGGSDQETQKKVQVSYYFNINPKLEDLNIVEDSWLEMEEYYEWVYSLYKKNQLKLMRVSDLLIYVTTIISPHRRNKMYLVLNSILDNYSIASQVSKQICERLSEE